MPEAAEGPVAGAAADRDPPALELTGVSVRTAEGRVLVGPLDWTVRQGERWVVLGPNGSGKTTLLRVASLYQHPSTGIVTVLGETLGRTDVRRLRTRVGVVSAALADQLRPALRAEDIVVTARYAALEPWWHTYTDADRGRARELLGLVGCAGFADRTFGTLSSGERQRVQIARALMADPGLVLLDEPNAGLDLGGREELVGVLADLARRPSTPPFVLVTHHVEEIPPGITHALLLRSGTPIAVGPIDDVLTADVLGSCFGLPVELTRRGDRYSAWAIR